MRVGVQRQPARDVRAACVSSARSMSRSVELHVDDRRAQRAGSRASPRASRCRARRCGRRTPPRTSLSRRATPCSRPNLRDQLGELAPAGADALDAWRRRSTRGFSKLPVRLGVDARALGQRRQPHLVEQPAEIVADHAQPERRSAGARGSTDPFAVAVAPVTETVSPSVLTRSGGEHGALPPIAPRAAARSRAGARTSGRRGAGAPTCAARSARASMRALQLAAGHGAQRGRDVALGVEVGERQVRVQRQSC